MDGAEVGRILDQLFNRFDISMDDSITWAEFGSALEAEGVDAASADLIRETVFADWDADRDLALTLQELRALAAAWAAPPGDQS